METKLEQSSATNPNPVVSVGKDGSVLYSNAAGEPLLHEWGARVGEKLPSSIGDLVRRVISQNSPEKMEVKVGKRVYLVAFHPLPDEECVNIYGFDISYQKELEEKLRESEIKYRNIVETSVEGIWIFNAVSETTYVNEKMAEMLGYTREEMIGRFIWDFAYEEDKGIFQVKLANRKQGIDEVYELKLIHKDGSPLWVSVSAKGFFDDAGKFAGSVGMFTDTTDRKRVEEALRESEEKYRDLFETVQEVFYLDRLIYDEQGNVVDWIFEDLNPAGFELLDLKDIDEAKGKRGSEVLSREVASFYLPMIEKARRSSKAVTFQYHSPYVDKEFLTSYIVRGDRLISSQMDVTELKRAEEALRESDERLRFALETINIGAWDLDLVDHTAYRSLEHDRIFGYEQLLPEWTYEMFLDHVLPEDREMVDAKFRKATTALSDWSFECRIRRVDGEVRW